MSTVPSIARRFGNVLVPTRIQVLGTFLLSLGILAPTQSRTLIQQLGLPPEILAAGSAQFNTRFDQTLNSNFVSQFALITFWAIVGLATYLVCWGGYNILIEARNEVTLKTSYINRGHWRNPHSTLALKAVAAVGLALTFATLRYGITFWITLAARFAMNPNVSTVGWCALAVIGLAFELYLVFVFIQLTFTPWYRATDVEEIFTEQ